MTHLHLTIGVTPRLYGTSVAILALAACQLAIPSAGATASAVLYAWPLSDTTISLSWPDFAAGDTFTVERAPARSAEWTVVAANLPATATAYTDTGLSPDSEYTYRVTALAGDTVVAGTGLARARTDDRPFGDRTLAFQDGMGGYAGTVDIGIMQTTPATNDTGIFVKVDYNSPADELQALVKFAGIIGDQPARIPAGTIIQNATLRLYLGTDHAVESTGVMYFHQMLVGWDAGSTWSHVGWGANGVQADDVDAVSVAHGAQVFSVKDTWYEVDVTATMQAWCDGAAVHGWVIRTDASDGYGYYTARNPVVAQRPELIVRFDTDPHNLPPEIVPQVLPATDAQDVPEPARISFTVADANNEPLRVSVYGRRAALPGDDFTVVILPDTQNYVASLNGGLPAMFTTQTDWIIANRAAHNIAFVLHMGDIVQNGDLKGGVANEAEWAHATQALYALADPLRTGLGEGIPFAVAVGNHDQTPGHDPDGTTTLFNKYFGIDYFSGRSTYGGHHGASNDNHYMLFDAGGYRFVVLSLEYRRAADPAILEWADGILKSHAGRRGIVVSHYIVGPGHPAPFGPYGLAIYQALRGNPNLGLLLGGHMNGEGWRSDVFEGRTVYSLLQNYQYYDNGGSGYLRLLTFSPRAHEIRIQTWSPWLGTSLEHFGGALTLPYDLTPPGESYAMLYDAQVDAGTHIDILWDGLAASTHYQWYAVVSDGRKEASIEPRTFRTASATYSDWRLQFFVEGDPDGHPLADPDGNGTSNYFEFVFAGDPLAGPRGASGAPTLVLGEGLARIRYQRPRATGLTWTYEVSDNLRDWQPVDGSALQQYEQVEIIDAGIEQVTLVIHNAGNTQFWRVRVR
jgi:hypothetical protein